MVVTRSNGVSELLVGQLQRLGERCRCSQESGTKPKDNIS
jgi:hypothetical protein